MYFLAVETSCDETAAAVFTDELKILSNVVASQTDLHVRFGGVVPEVAARAHLQRLLPVIDEALRKAGIALHDIGCVAVLNSPGLVGSLLIGVSAAKILAVALDVPLINANHIEAHVYACRFAPSPLSPEYGREGDRVARPESSKGVLNLEESHALRIHAQSVPPLAPSPQPPSPEYGGEGLGEPRAARSITPLPSDDAEWGRVPPSSPLSPVLGGEGLGVRGKDIFPCVGLAVSGGH